MAEQSTLAAVPATLPLAPEGREEIVALTGADLERARQTCRYNLYFLSKAVLGYGGLTPHTHRPLCEFLVRCRVPRRMILMPRGFFKSTIATIADSIRLSLIDPEHCRILIVNERAENAEGFLSVIKGLWEKCEPLRHLFPELVPERTSGPGVKWGGSIATLRRHTSYREGTYNAIGIGGAVTSQHFSHMKPDDFVGDDADVSQAVLEKAKAWADRCEPLLTRLDDPIDWIGTRRGIGDGYQHIIETTPGIKVFRRPALENGVSIFPERFSTARLLSMKAEKAQLFAAHYENDPISGTARDWADQTIEPWAWNTKGEIAFRREGRWRAWRREDLFRFTLIDPNSGRKTALDKAGVVTVGQSPDDELIFLESKSDRWNPDQLIEEAFEQACRWQVHVVGHEEAGQQNIDFHFRKLMRKKGRFFRLQALKHRNQDKEYRIRTAFDTPLREGKVIVPERLRDLRYALRNFPDLRHGEWDELDPAAYFPQVGRRGLAEAEATATKAVHERILAARGQTGYGT